MQTFLPHRDFIETAKCLDYKRLGNQRKEAKTIIDILENKIKSSAWRNHPAVLMWKDNIPCLKYYFNKISEEWSLRGYQHNMGFYLVDLMLIEFPTWLGNEKFHLSHQSNLVRKFPEHYRKFFPDIPDDLPYYWPVEKDI